MILRTTKKLANALGAQPVPLRADGIPDGEKLKGRPALLIRCYDSQEFYFWDWVPDADDNPLIVER